MKFLAPNKPVATCESKSCNECNVNKTLHCHFTLKDLVYFLMIVTPSFLLGGAGIYYAGFWLLIPWLLFMVGYFGFLEIRVMCSHCPHYAEEGTTLKCWANYGSPKLWKYRPGPMNFLEKIVFLAGLVIIWGYPLFFLVYNFQLFLLIVYLLTSISFFMTLRTFLCTQCMNFACPLNAVKDEIRRDFFKKNPKIAKAWDVDIKH